MARAPAFPRPARAGTARPAPGPIPATDSRTAPGSAAAAGRCRFRTPYTATPAAPHIPPAGPVAPYRGLT